MRAPPPWSRSTARLTSSPAATTSAPSPRRWARRRSRRARRSWPCCSRPGSARVRASRSAGARSSRRSARTSACAAWRCSAPRSTSAPTCTAHASARSSRSRGGSAELARDLAMHVSWSNPRYLSTTHVPAEVVASERDILTQQAKSEGKPPEIVAKMVEGRLRKALNEVTLAGQAFVKDPDVSIEKLLKSAGAEVVAFERFEVGAGLDKKTEDFVADVMAQVKGKDKGKDTKVH